MKKRLASAMTAASEELGHWESRVAGLLISAGMVETPRWVYKRCEEILAAVEESEAKLGALGLLLQLAEQDEEIRNACIDRLLRLHDPGLRLKAVVAIGRLSAQRNSGLPNRDEVTATGVRLLLDSANSGRDVYLYHLVNLAPALGFQDEPALWESLALFMMEVDEQWNWL